MRRAEAAADALKAPPMMKPKHQRLVLVAPALAALVLARCCWRCGA
jgi:hypothetical protein